MIHRALFISVALSTALVADPAVAAGRAHEPAPEGFVRWAGAAQSLSWRGGGEATLVWEPGPRFREVAERAPIEEWEAFLSLDGGRSWSVRLTPHLSVAVRRITVELPPIAAAEARMLLRFGDERRELEVELPQRFRLEAPLRGRAWPARRAWRAGEAARPGGRGVLFWAEVGRAAPALELYESEPTGTGLSAALLAGPPPLLAAVRTRDEGAEPTPAEGDRLRAPSARLPGGAGRGIPPHRGLTALGATCRLNL